jgi:hypothetical protein
MKTIYSFYVINRKILTEKLRRWSSGSMARHLLKNDRNLLKNQKKN